ncbi:MFS transporter [Lactococcus hodotermopsidis]|uniref:MFS transporter n=1 Tax=Pseudolactococcus hodotermopsidis TaxID=2709157 RepID=A0A6A0BET9_9LACT|nr:MFS transporter [Lactococcus hodotermopsidis]GFH43213.1 MFS transporter [Lactococcus hodotermopsidis]
MWQQLHSNIRTRIKIQFLSRFASSLIFPFMTIYLTRAYQVQIAGILVMISVVISFISGVYGGHLTDIFGRRSILLIGELLKLLTAIVIFLASFLMAHPVLIIYFMMLLNNIASACISPASEAMLIDVSSEETRGFMYAINYWASNLSMMLGITIGGWLFEKAFIWLVISLVIINTINFLLTKFFITETHYVEKTSHKRLGLGAVFASYQVVFSDLRFVLFTIGGILIMTVEFQRTNYISVHLAQEFLPQSVFGITFDGLKIVSLMATLNTLLIVLLTVPISKMVTRYANNCLFIIGVALFSLGYAIQAISLDFVILVVSSVILSIGELFYVPTRQSKLAELMVENKRGAYVAFNGIIFKLGQIIAAGMLMLSPIIGAFGIFILIIMSGFLAIVTTSVALKLK